MDGLHGFAEQAERNLALFGHAGMVVSVVSGEKTVLESFGFRDAEQRLAPDADTLFPIGSATKSFTAAALMLLSRRGQLDIDAPIRRYLPELLFFDPDASAHATARDLLCHRTGLARHDMLWVLRPHITRRELVASIRALLPSAPFRARYQYSNLMFACLGRLVEVIDGRTWENFVRDEIFAPLNMRSATFNVDDMVAYGDFALPYVRDRKSGALNNVPFSRLGGMAPAGAINASAREMAHWTRCLLSEGSFDGREILSGTREMRTPQMPAPSELFTFPELRGASYALGWEVESFRGYTLVSHGGNVSGGSALVAYMPELGFGVNVMVNTGSSLLTYATAYDALDRLMGFAETKDWGAELFAVTDRLYALTDAAVGSPQAARGAKTARAAAEFAGLYRHPAYGAVAVTADGGKLSARLGQRAAPLENVHYDVFAAEIDLGYLTAPTTLSFQTGLDGGIEAVELPLEGAVAPIVFKRDKV
ncbi:MAG: serine hydrolase [Clostridiales bacterium]|nr:serine hydrolase [Clostridiales bacterium]